jgi:hypothetical protein
VAIHALGSGQRLHALWVNVREVQAGYPGVRPVLLPCQRDAGGGMVPVRPLRAVTDQQLVQVTSAQEGPLAIQLTEQLRLHWPGMDTLAPRCSVLHAGSNLTQVLVLHSHLAA